MCIDENLNVSVLKSVLGVECVEVGVVPRCIREFVGCFCSRRGVEEDD